MTEITAVARAIAKPGRRHEVSRLLRSVIAPTLQEPRVLHYSIHQGADSPDVFVTIERWRGTADLEHHLSSATIQRLAATLSDLLAESIALTTLRELNDDPSPSGTG